MVHWWNLAHFVGRLPPLCARTKRSQVELAAQLFVGRVFLKLIDQPFEELVLRGTGTVRHLHWMQRDLDHKLTTNMRKPTSSDDMARRSRLVLLRETVRAAPGFPH